MGGGKGKGKGKGWGVEMNERIFGEVIALRI